MYFFLTAENSNHCVVFVVLSLLPAAFFSGQRCQYLCLQGQVSQLNGQNYCLTLCSVGYRSRIRFRKAVCTGNFTNPAPVTAQASGDVFQLRLWRPKLFFTVRWVIGDETRCSQRGLGSYPAVFVETKPDIFQSGHLKPSLVTNPAVWKGDLVTFQGLFVETKTRYF